MGATVAGERKTRPLSAEQSRAPAYWKRNSTLILGYSGALPSRSTMR